MICEKMALIALRQHNIQEYPLSSTPSSHYRLGGVRFGNPHPHILLDELAVTERVPRLHRVHELEIELPHQL